MRHEPRQVGQSNYTFRKLADARVQHDDRASARCRCRSRASIGFVFTLFGFGILAIVLLTYLTNGGSAVPGFAFLASIIAIFSGAQLFALGIIGEYLARMHFRTMDRPTYLVRDVTDDD